MIEDSHNIQDLEIYAEGCNMIEYVCKRCGIHIYEDKILK